MNRINALLLAAVCVWLACVSAAWAGPGFLVVAKDRGTVGNQELAAAVDNLDPEFPVQLLLVGPNRQGVEDDYAGYIAAARDGLEAAGADSVIAIPLFVSGQDALLARFRPRIEQALAPLSVAWTPALAQSYLGREIVIDRIRSANGPTAGQRLLLVLQGARDAVGAARLRELGERLLADVADVVPTAAAEVAVRYAEIAPRAAAEQAESKLARRVDRLAEKGPTVLVPLIIDVKFTPHMSLEMGLKRRYGREGVTITPSAMPHPAVRTWLQSMINASVPARDESIGFVIMPHGSSAPYNDDIVAAMPELLDRHPSAFAFGMASPLTIKQAVRKLEAEGVRHAVFLRLFSGENTFRAGADYIIGLRNTPPAHGHGGTPERVRTPIRFVSSGGYQSDALISQVLKDRILEISSDPASESVLLLSHGSRSDAANAAGLERVQGNIEGIQAALETPLRDIRALGLREDWPEKRAEALRAIHQYIEQANRDGRALVIANRLQGSGSYEDYLEGLEYEMNGKGLIPHPAFTRWVDKTLQAGIEALKNGAAAVEVRDTPRHH